MSSKAAAHTSTDPVETASSILVGSGVLVMALFPLAIPMIALLAVVALLLLPLVLAPVLAVAALAAPVLLLRGLWRKRTAMRSRRRRERPGPRLTSGAHRQPSRGADGLGVASSGVMPR